MRGVFGLLFIIYVQGNAQIFRLLPQNTNRPITHLRNWRSLHSCLSRGTVFLIEVAAFLILYSVQDFYTEQYYTFLAVQNDNSETLPMQIDIIFNRMPCNGTSSWMQPSPSSFMMNWNTSRVICRKK
jgi:hypothetical protein